MHSIEEFYEETRLLFCFYFVGEMGAAKTKEVLNQIIQTYGYDTRKSRMFYGKDAEPLPPEELPKSGGLFQFFGEIFDGIEEDGFFKQRLADSIIIYLFHLWEEKYREKLILPNGKSAAQNSDLMGDLRLIRNCIIHNKRIGNESIERCKILHWFSKGDKIVITQDHIYELWKRLFQEYFQILFQS